MIRAALALALVAAAPAGQIDPRALAQLDGYAAGWADAGKFSGVVLVADGDRIVLEKPYGSRDEAREDAPITIDTRFNIASVGKMFTSVAILQLIAAGKISLDTRVGQVLPDYRNAAVRDVVTVRQLLTHTSGTGELNVFGAEGAANRARAHSVADFLRLHDDRAPVFTPGSKQEYDNFAFIILGRMVEVLSGESYEAYVAKHIFVPAGMTRTGFVDCTTDAPDIAIGYATVDGRRVRNCTTQPVRGLPAGGELSTARDLFRFTQALRQGRLIPPALFTEATRTHTGFMGLGFFATDYGKDIPARNFRWGHGGSTDGANTDVRVYPRTGETVIVLANRDAPVAHAIARMLHDRHKEWAGVSAR